MTFILSFIAIHVFAPPTKPAIAEGRISLWVHDRFEQFRPDGADAIAMPPPDNELSNQWRLAVSPDGKTAVYLDNFGFRNQGTYRDRLVIGPVDGRLEKYTLDGYAVSRFLISADWSNVYFQGVKGNLLSHDIQNRAPWFVLNRATKKVESLSLPEGHWLQTISTDEKTFVTTKTDADKKSYSRRTYFVAVGEKPTEMFPENVFVSHCLFSPNGAKVLCRCEEYVDLRPDGIGGFRHDGVKPVRYVIWDVATKTATPVRGLPENRSLQGWAWSPTGDRIAYVSRDPKADIEVEAPSGDRMWKMYGFQVFVADADGANPKPVRTTHGRMFRDFIWQK
jgi:dipeptidyl aminopeptidase/acylaminoacyl peptidase